MHTRSIDLHTPHVIAAIVGVVFAVVVLSWLFWAGVDVSVQGPIAVGVAFAYAVVGMFLLAAVPVYLFGRMSLCTPAAVTLWFLGNTVYQWLYGAHLHPLSSYLNIWPVLFGIVLGVSLGEAVLRVGLDRTFGRLGLHRIC